jgi:hypothetical protein
VSVFTVRAAPLHQLSQIPFQHDDAAFPVLAVLTAQPDAISIYVFPHRAWATYNYSASPT